MHDSVGSHWQQKKWFFYKFDTTSGFEHLSYKLRLFSAVEDTMNTVLQRCVDHGIISYLVAKNRRLLSGTQYNYNNVIATAYNPLTISDMQNLYLLYALGIVLSTITLIAENIYCQINMIMNQRKVKSKTKITIVARWFIFLNALSFRFSHWVIRFGLFWWGGFLLENSDHFYERENVIFFALLFMLVVEKEWRPIKNVW